MPLLIAGRASLFLAENVRFLQRRRGLIDSSQRGQIRDARDAAHEEPRTGNHAGIERRQRVRHLERRCLHIASTAALTATTSPPCRGLIR